jgi:hypothetical protein
MRFLGYSTKSNDYLVAVINGRKMFNGYIIQLVKK